MILQNLVHLNQAKNDTRAQSLTAISTDEAMLDHVTIVEAWMDAILIRSTQIKARSANDLTIQQLGVRLFNSTACALDLILSGFYQASTSHVRDVTELSFLLTDFKNNPLHVQRWRESEGNDRKKFFQPVNVRMRIDSHDGFTKQKRKKAYETLSNYGAHPTPASSIMLTRDGLICAGPFFERKLLKAMIEELTMRLATGALTFCEFFLDYPEVVRERAGLEEKTEKWRNVYFSSKVTP